MTNPETRYRGFLVDTTIAIEAVTAQIEQALARANAELGTTFEPDGAEEQDGVLYTVWADDVNGTTATSWVRLTEVPAEQLRHLEINATTDRIFERLGALFATEVATRPVT